MTNKPLINDNFTSTGAKFFAHQEVMSKLQDGIGRPIVSHIMLTDSCNHSCAFCSVHKRKGDSLSFNEIEGYLDTLISYGLKAVILSGGGNPILYKCRETGKNFNDVVDYIHSKGLEIGLITNGMPLREFEYYPPFGQHPTSTYQLPCIRESWGTVRPETLDKITWIRISMSGFDHPEGEVYVPDIDSTKTALGFSYVVHDIYLEPADPHHGKVSRQLDLISNKNAWPDFPLVTRLKQLTKDIGDYCVTYKPRYVRLLPNCLEPELISNRCEQLREMASTINSRVEREVAFVQYKPPAAPKACYLGYVHPVLNCDGYVYPCDSCVLNEEAGHSFSNPWRICHWTNVSMIYETPVQSLIQDPGKTCPGCVFTRSNELLGGVVDKRINLPVVSTSNLEHTNFV